MTCRTRMQKAGDWLRACEPAHILTSQVTLSVSAHRRASVKMASDSVKMAFSAARPRVVVTLFITFVDSL